MIIERIPFPRRERKLPMILSQEEVKALLEAQRHRALLAVLYGCGVRVAEVTHLKVTDIGHAPPCGVGAPGERTQGPANAAIAQAARTAAHLLAS
jgi:site-specific recombinase XerC